MRKFRVSHVLYLSASIIMLFTAFLIVTSTSPVLQTFDTNTKKLSLLSLQGDFSAMNCEIYNDIAVDVNGVKKTLVSANERVNPFIDTIYLNKLSLQVDSKNVENMYYQIWALCNGKVFANGKSTVVIYGTMDLNVRGVDVKGSSYYFYGNENFFGTQYTKFTLPQTLVKQNVNTLIGEVKIPKSTLDQKLGLNTFSGSTTSHFKTIMIPDLKWDIVHPSVGNKFTAEYDFHKSNEKIIAQYRFNAEGNFKNTDTDGDGILDTNDQCPTQKETVNGYLDNDGCPDTNPDGTDTDGDGISDNLDQCPTQKETVNGYLDNDGCPDTNPDGSGNPIYRDTDDDGIPDDKDQCLNLPETYNGYQDDDGCPDQNPTTTKEIAIVDWTPKIIDRTNLLNPTIREFVSLSIENYDKKEGGMTTQIMNLKGVMIDSFPVADVCLKDNPTGGFLTCEYSFDLVMSKYPVDQYTIKILSPSRTGQSPSVTFDVIQTKDGVIEITDPDTDDGKIPDVTPDSIRKIIESILSGEGFANLTSSSDLGGVIVSKSTKFGIFDVVIILSLAGVTVLILLIAKYMKKKRF